MTASATVDLATLRDLVARALRHYGYTQDEIVVMSEVLLYSQLRGGNQGVAKLVGSGIPRAEPERSVAVTHRGAVTVVDGGQHHAMVVVDRAAQVAIDRAPEHGVAVVGVHSTSTSSGSLGYYARTIAEARLVGIVLASSPRTVAPHGSVDPILGTNPLAIAVPTSATPIVLDMTTAAMPFFGVIEAAVANRPLPEGIALDASGSPTTDPARAMDGALVTFDRGHRGSGLSFMIQLLAGPLVGASGPGLDDEGKNWGHLIIAIDPGHLQDAGVAEGADLLASVVHSARRSVATTPVYLPGERGDAVAAHATQTDGVAIEPALLDALQQVAALDGTG